MAAFAEVLISPAEASSFNVCEITLGHGKVGRGDGGGGRMHSPTGLLAEKFLRCVSAPGCAPQPTLVGAHLLSMASKIHALAAPWAPATLGRGGSPYSFPFPHPHVCG